MKYKLALLILIPFLFASCEGYKLLNGVVISEKTGKPISNAKIIVLNGRKQITRTNSSGKFSITSEFTGLWFGGPKFVFEIKKEGYKTKLVKKRGSQEII